MTEPTRGATEPPPERVVPRHNVLRRLTNLYEEARYLEIGVCEGATFNLVPAARKVAVDPEFRFDHERAARSGGPGVEYHQVTSDEYFASRVDPGEQFDVIYLDGLHVFEQTLRDLMNALAHLQPRGVVVVDDTRPPTYLASLPDRDNFFAVRRWMGIDDQRWMGDVVKVVWFVEAFCPQLSFRTISNNHGQTVLWRHRRAEVPQRSMGEVDGLTFERLVLDEHVLRLATFGDIRREVRRDLGL